MRAFHDSRNNAYRKPYGAILPGTAVTLRLDVWDEPGAQVSLRTWIDGEGESRYAMTSVNAAEDGGPTRYSATIAPAAPGTVWYQFIIDAADGRTMRYGAQDGRFGGPGQLRDWEPPSFQLAVNEPGADNLLVKEIFDGTNPMLRPPTEMTVGFLRNETTARELAESIETLHEACPEHVFQRAFDLMGSYSQSQLFALLAGASASEAASPNQTVNYHQDPEKGGLAKGRLWAACLIQMLIPDKPVARTADRLGSTGVIAHETPVVPGHEDADCEAIVQNVVDLHRTLPVFSRGRVTCFALNDDVFGMWRRGDDGRAVCVLVNASLQTAYDVPVPMVAEAVSDVLGGYAVPVVDADAAGELQNAIVPAARYAMPHLYQLGTAVLYFHPEQRLEAPMEPGLGVLAHITSLPVEQGATAKPEAETQPGTLGAPARAFVDWLAQAGARYWQVLPVNPTDEYGSPYAGISAFAGNLRLLEADAEPDESLFDTPDYQDFRTREADWLEPYAAFMAIRQKMGDDIPWQEWPEAYLHFSPSIIEADPELQAATEKWAQAQYRFEREWRELRAYANERGVKIVGDMPIYVSADSSDVWANPHIFQLDEAGMPAVVAGCPPDAFAEEGQVWGNPVYDWDALAQDGYRWWLRRLARAFDLYDFVRLDHFIGFCRYFCIPAGEKATAGSYEPGPGLEFFHAARRKFGALPIIAEDLGAITPAVRTLVAACGFPGMDIVQFVDGNDPLSGYVPRPEKVSYTGTHDNQTLVGYAAARYPQGDAREVAFKLAEAVAACGAPVVVLPLQDLMLLDNDARMNTPGTAKGNWAWQADAVDMDAALETARKLVALHQAHVQAS